MASGPKPGDNLVTLARVLGVTPARLRTRLNYHKIKTREATLPQMVAVLPEDLRTKHRAALSALMRHRHADPEPRANPRKHEAPEPNVRLALAALYRAAKAMGPVRLDELDDVASGIADAIQALGGGRHHRG